VIQEKPFPRRPGLRYLAGDLAVGIFLAWLVPHGIDLLARPIDPQWRLGQTRLSGVEVVALTTVVLFILQNAVWVNGMMAAATASIGDQISDWTKTALPATLSSGLLNEMAAHLLGRGETGPGYVRGLELYTNVYTNLPRETRLGAALLLSRELQHWADHCEQLRTEGIGISQEEQVALIDEVSRSASTFLLIDPTLYQDIGQDWTKAWRALVAGELAGTDLRREYVYLASDSIDRLSRGDRAKLDALALFMTSHGWSFYTCSEGDVSSTAVPPARYGRLMEVFDDTLMISMPKTESFTTGELTTTRLSIIDDDERRLIDSIRKYKRPYPPSVGSFDRVSQLVLHFGENRR
jgi:hypothetical protein